MMKKKAFLTILLFALLFSSTLTMVRAETYKVGIVTVSTQNPNPVTVGSIATYSITVNRGVDRGSVTGRFDANLTIVGPNTLPSDAKVLFSPETVYFSSKDSQKKSTLTIQTSTPGEYTFTIKVTRNDAPYDYVLVENNMLKVVSPPVLNPIGNKSARVNTELSFTITATDGDLPNDQLTFTLEDGNFTVDNLPTLESQIGGVSAVFSWTPTLSQLHESYHTTVRVTDSYGLIDEETITIDVTGNVLPGDTTVVVDENVALTFEAGGVTSEGLALSESNTDATYFNWYALGGYGWTQVGPYYNITVTAGFNGAVIVEIQYDTTSLEPNEEDQLRLVVNHGYDFDSNGVIDVKDQVLLANAINTNGRPYDPTYDLNHDGQLNSDDLQILKLHLGENAWIDITTYVDTVANIIYGETDQFSGFGVHR